jgi:hypothetical protein
MNADESIYKQTFKKPIQTNNNINDIIDLNESVFHSSYNELEYIKDHNKFDINKIKKHTAIFNKFTDLNINDFLNSNLIKSHPIKNEKVIEWINEMKKINAPENHEKIVEMATCIKCISFNEYINNFNLLLDGIMNKYIAPKKIKHVYLYCPITNDKLKSNIWCSAMAFHKLKYFYNMDVSILYSTIDYLILLTDKKNKSPILYVDDVLYTGEQFQEYILYEYIGRINPLVPIYLCIPYIGETFIEDFFGYKYLQNKIIIDKNVNILRTIYKYTMNDERILTYFEHKFADSVSLNHDILIEGKVFDLSTYYKQRIKFIGSLINCDFKYEKAGTCFETFYKKINIKSNFY